MLMKKVMHSYGLADAPQFPGRRDPKNKWEIVQEKLDKNPGIHVTKRDQAPLIQHNKHDRLIPLKRILGASQNINLEAFRVNLYEVQAVTRFSFEN